MAKKRHKCERDGVMVEIEYEETKLKICPFCKEKLDPYPLKVSIDLYGKEEEVRAIGEESGLSGQSLKRFISFFTKISVNVNLKGSDGNPSNQNFARMLL